MSKKIYLKKIWSIILVLCLLLNPLVGINTSFAAVPGDEGASEASVTPDLNDMTTKAEILADTNIPEDFTNDLWLSTNY